MFHMVHIPISGSDSEEIWEEKVSDDPEAFVCEDPPPALPQGSAVPSCKSIVSWLVGFLLLLQARHYIPDAGMNSLLKLLHVLFHVLCRFFSCYFICGNVYALICLFDAKISWSIRSIYKVYCLL